MNLPVASTLALMTSMPGRSHEGPLPALTGEEASVALGLRQHVTQLATLIGERHLLLPERLAASANYVGAQLAAAGWSALREPFTVAGIEVANVVAERRGGSHAGQIVLVGAHYDAVPGCPGANDNGSGVAAVLEMARLLDGARLDRTVRLVLFVNEEPPHFQTDAMGSLVHARACRARGEAVVAMLSIETIGFYSDEPGSQNYPFPFSFAYPSTGNFVGFVSDLGARPLLRQAVGSFRAHTAFPSEGLAGPAFVPGISWSDHWSFREQGYPALMVTDTAPYRYPHYHQPEDTPDRLVYDRAARVVCGLARVVADLASAQ